MNKEFGVLLKANRESKGLSIREFCRKAKADPSNISKIERGLMNPPKKKEIINRYSYALGLTPAAQTELYQAACRDNMLVPDPSHEEVQKLIRKFLKIGDLIDQRQIIIRCSHNRPEETEEYRFLEELHKVLVETSL